MRTVLLIVVLLGAIFILFSIWAGEGSNSSSDSSSPDGRTGKVTTVDGHTGQPIPDQRIISWL